MARKSRGKQESLGHFPPITDRIDTTYKEEKNFRLDVPRGRKGKKKKCKGAENKKKGLRK